MKHKHSVICLAVIGIMPAHAMAVDTEQELNTIHVIGTTTKQPYAQYMDDEEIKKQPTRNGNITELLRSNPNVQFNSSTNSGYAAGEIAPANVSFHGSPYYNNNFTLDGLSNNDIVNPGATDGVGMSYSTYVNSSSGSLPPGNPQTFYVDSGLVKDLRVYDSNVPAKYGQFTGGVVDADLKEPSLAAPSGSISFRTTRDNWTHLHEEEDAEDPLDGDATNANSGQPEFTKRIYHIDINQPLSERASIMMSYDRTESKIPKYQPYLGGKENETRRSETLLLKGLYQLTDTDKLVASIMYSPHTGRYLPTNSVRDGSMSISGGGWQNYIDWEHEFERGQVNTRIAYTEKTNRRSWSSDEAFIQHSNAPASLGWCSGSASLSGTCTAREGGYPDDYTKHTTWTLKQDWKLLPFEWGAARHQLDFGWQADIAKARYKRDGDHITNYSAQSSVTGFDLTGCFDCNEAEGWSLVRKVVYPQTDTQVGVNTYGLYFEDQIGINRLTLTPGVRVDHDQFLGNTNISPRFAFNVDVSNNGRTNVFGGANRYYAGNMVYYALRAALPAGRVYGSTSGQNMRQPTQAWEDTVQTTVSGISYDNITDLDTPYSDELNIGLSQVLGNNNLTLKYVYREGKDLFKQGRNDDGTRYLTNDGRSRGKTLSLQMGSDTPYKIGPVELGYRFGAKYFRTSNNNRYAYDNLSFEDQLDWKAIVDDQLLDPDQIPALDFNQKWSVFLELDTALPKWGLTWTHRLNYADGYRAYVSSAVNCATAGLAACGDYTGRAYNYRKRDFKDAFTLDWRINLAIPMGGKKKLDLTADILNVFDTKVGANIGTGVNGSMSSSGVASGYEVGRQIWLGAAYRW